MKDAACDRFLVHVNILNIATFFILPDQIDFSPKQANDVDDCGACKMATNPFDESHDMNSISHFWWQFIENNEYLCTCTLHTHLQLQHGCLKERKKKVKFKPYYLESWSFFFGYSINSLRKICNWYCDKMQVNAYWIGHDRFAFANEIIYKERIIANKKGWNALECRAQSVQLCDAMQWNQRLFTIPHIAHGGAHTVHMHITFFFFFRFVRMESRYSPVYHRVSLYTSG